MKNNRTILLMAVWVVSCLALLSGCTHPFAGKESGEEALAERVDSLLRTVYADSLAPGGAVLIVKDGHTVLERCYGLADLATRTPVTPNTNFCIASVSKQFTAIALLQLVERGMLDLNAPLTDYFPEFTLPDLRNVTVRHLLSHTSGIPDARDRSDRHFVLTATDSASTAYIRSLKALNFEPGTQYEYINPTFQLASLLIPRVVADSLEHFVYSQLLEPAGMNNTVYFQAGRDIPNMAHGYTRNDSTGGYDEFDYGEESFFATKADGGLYTSIRDFARWEEALAEGEVVCSTQSVKQAYAPQVAVPPTANYGYQPHTFYGLGFFIQMRPGRCPVVYHTGDNGGFTIYAGKVPAHNVVLLLFSTRDDIDRMGIVNQILDWMEPLGWLEEEKKQ